MPDATGLELLAQDLRDADPDAVLDTLHFRDRATLIINPARVRPALQWLRANQLPVRAGNREWPAWRAHSLNYDREHGGSRGEPWRRLFMSDAATALASLALSTSD